MSEDYSKMWKQLGVLLLIAIIYALFACNHLGVN